MLWPPSQESSSKNYKLPSRYEYKMLLNVLYYFNCYAYCQIQYIVSALLFI